MLKQSLLFFACLALAVVCPSGLRAQDLSDKILTPAPAPEPRINGPSVFGVRPGSPFLYTIPATGTRPVSFSAENLPDGLTLDAATGRITGLLKAPGEHAVVLKAVNALGSSIKKFRVVCGDNIALTPPMGWNSWNCWAAAVDQEKVLRSAKALAGSGLSQHGWTYVNIDDTWQGSRSGPSNALQGNEKFPDMKALVDQIHALGLKAGIYSTPWETSYAKFPGGSCQTEDGAWNKIGWKFGAVSRAKADARQWADWGFDYLKYDWHPITAEHLREMSEALRSTNRDMVYSLSNSSEIKLAPEFTKLANCWRTTGDISDRWDNGGGRWQYTVSEIAFSQDQWAARAEPGRWNDPDMLVVGQVGWGPKLHPTRLTPDQQYAHISMWCLLSAPLLIGCDLEKLDPFTISLLSNDEVLAIDQDSLGKQATRLATYGPIDVYVKDLDDDSKAVGFFNRSKESFSGKFTKLGAIGLGRKHLVRDLWRQKDLLEIDSKTALEINVPGDGVLLLRFTPVK